MRSIKKKDKKEIIYKHINILNCNLISVKLVWAKQKTRKYNIKIGPLHLFFYIRRSVKIRLQFDLSH